MPLAIVLDKQLDAFADRTSQFQNLLPTRKRNEKQRKPKQNFQELGTLV